MPRKTPTAKTDKCWQQLLDFCRAGGVAIHLNDGITGTFAWTKDGSGVFGFSTMEEAITSAVLEHFTLKP